MTQVSTQRDRHSESGIALLIAIFVLLLITAIGAGMIMLTNTEINTSANFRDEQTAWFASKAGIEEVRDRLRTAATNSLSGSLPTVLLGQNNGALYILNPSNGETDKPWITNGTFYPDTEVCSEYSRLGIVGGCANNSPPAPGAGTSWYTKTTASASYAANPVLPWKWTRVNLKTNQTSSGTTAASTVDGNVLDTTNIACWTGAGEITTPLAGTPFATCSALGSGYEPVYVLTTLAVTPSLSRRMMQAEAAALNFNLPGAMIFDGSNPVYGAPASAAFTVTGNDQNSGANSLRPQGVTCPSAFNEPAIGAYDANSVTALTGDVSSRPTSYTGNGNVVTPSISNENTSLGQLTTVGGLDTLVSEVTAIALPANTYNGNASSITNPGTTANPVVNVVTGDLTIGGSFTGSGILLVEGNLTMTGAPSYNGLILVIGKGTVTKSGGGNGVVDGSLFLANLYNSSGQLLPASSAPGVPSMTWGGGGTMTFQYDSCWATQMSQALNYRIVAVREMIY
jgi:hypothetical protein